ncbi:MAG: ABC transporter substrate-binding protein [Chloroflexota bacterium]
MSKRYLLIGVFIAMLLLAACEPAATPGGDASTSGDAVELSFWTEWSGEPDLEVGNALVAQFNELHPNITVVHRPIENEQFFTALRTGFTSGEPPDIFQHEGHGNLTQFVVPGEVEDISDWWAENGDRFQAGTEASIMHEGKHYGVPWTIHTDTQIWYNEAILEEHGIDPASLNTWNDYLAAFAQLKEAGVTPIAFANKFGWSGSQWFFAFLVRVAGAEKALQLAARNCDYSWTDEDVLAAAKLYTDLNEMDYFTAGKASDDFPAATALFFAGRAAFFHSGSWFVGDIAANSPPDFRVGMKTFPIVEGGAGDPDEIVMQGLGGLAISKKGAEKNREAALTFIEWMTQLPQAQFYVKGASAISPVAGAVNEETASPMLQQIVDEQIADNTGSFPFLEHILPKTVGEEAIWMGSVGVLTGQLTAEEWMANVEEDAASQDPIYTRDAACE